MPPDAKTLLLRGLQVVIILLLARQVIVRLRALLSGQLHVPRYIHALAFGSVGLGAALAWMGQQSGYEAKLSPMWLLLIFPSLVYAAFLVYGGPVGISGIGDGAMFERAFKVDIDDEGVACTDPNGHCSRVAWSDIRSVEIRTNDSGPWGADVWWALKSDAGIVAIPQGATGEDKLLEALQRLPRFSNDTVISAMGCTSNRVFLCWRAESLPPDAHKSASR
jgi:hypothetical protein